MADDALKQRLAWLEEERRKDHSLLLSLQERLVALEGDYRAVTEQIKELGAGLAQINAVLGRFDQLEGRIAKVEREATQRVEDLEKRLEKRHRESEAAYREDLENLREYIAQAHTRLEVLPSLEQGLVQREQEILELRRAIEALEARLESAERSEEDRVRTIRLLQEAQDRTTQRLVDVQGEVTAFRKRLDEQAAQIQVFGETLRKLELRLQDLSTAEHQRKQEQKDFLEAQNRRWVKWERTWKSWESRFQGLEELSQQVEDRLRSWDELQREVKRAQERFEGMSERMERRINEITELQRLAEDRFRQEWTTFKADDQKRWANYMLAQDERNRDLERRLERLNEQLTQLQDGLQALDDVVKMTDEQVRKRLQGLVALAQNWMSDYERLMGTMKIE